MDGAQETQERERVAIPRFFLRILTTALAAGGAFLVTQLFNQDSTDNMALIASVTIGSSALIVQYLVDFGEKQEALARRERRSEEKEAYQNLLEPDSLKILMDLNQRQIEGYHDIVTKQAKQSYRSAQFAMWSGVAMLAACLYVGLRYNAAEIKAFAATMGAVSGAMTGYLSKTYLAIYRDTLSQLNRYFDQPVKNGYFLAAERLAGDSMPEMRQRIIEQILHVSVRSNERQGEPIPPSGGKKNGLRSKPGLASGNSAKRDGQA
ncbi:hypothetical protein ACFY1L_26955 [Streptomyces sp. NPDC001663]|uniref:hypothetical protein n=1 Tax=Streptomyces sp. NPDC001663 TaxID=3364597 RepID=UPI0036CA228F